LPYCEQKLHKRFLEEDNHQNMPKKRIGTVFARNLAYFLLLSFIVWSGCHKKESTANTASDSLAATVNTNGQIDLVALNELLHKYVSLKKQVPKDINELVTSGFTPNLPTPPPGKRLLIVKNPFGYQVVLADDQQGRR
jgi:hypothetical protein